MTKKGEALPPDIYTKEYFLEDCGGHVAYKSTGGRELDERLKLCLDVAKIEKGMKVLDIGCGRGEIVLNAALRGADVKGIDYSQDALDLAEGIIPDELKDQVSFECADVKSLNEPDNFYDVVLMTDVVEHLHNWELEILFESVYKMLKDDGRVVVHTAPNKTLYDVAYPVARFLARFRGHKLPKDIRTDYEKAMHINEQTMKNLTKLLAKQRFDYVKAFTDFDFIPNMTPGDRFFKSLSTSKKWESYFGRSLLVVATKNPQVSIEVEKDLFAFDLENDLIFYGDFYSLEPGSRWSGPSSELIFLADGDSIKLTLMFERPEQFFPDVLQISSGDFKKDLSVLEAGKLEIDVPVNRGEMNSIKLKAGKYFVPKECGMNEDGRQLSFRIIAD